MNRENRYKINIEEIRFNFKITGTGLKHSQGKRFKLLPYAANEKTLVSDFNGVVGAFSRLISNKELQSEFNIDRFISEVSEQIGDYEGELSEDVFKDLVRTMFIDGDKLVHFDIRTLNYITATSADEKVAKFLYSLFFDSETNEKAVELYDRDIDNVLYKLVLRALPELKDKNYVLDEYKCYLEFVKEVFIKDFSFLIMNEDLYKTSIKRLLEYYYMFYVSQLAIKLGQFEKADLTKAEKIYYTLSWESTSKNRTAYRFGWDLLENSINSLFSHAIVLELLNHHGIDDQFGYKQLADIYGDMEEGEVDEQLREVLQEYRNNITDKPWGEMGDRDFESEINGFTLVRKLFYSVEHQFVRTTRTRAYDAYKNWFTKFIYENFSKKRGPLGYNLNMTEEDIILMTKICIKNDKRMKLNTLFGEFELRGLFFDMDSKIKIIQLYEKLSLLEKKSDSGDAQYVRSVL